MLRPPGHLAVYLFNSFLWCYWNRWPGNAEIITNLASIFSRDGDRDQAERILEAYVSSAGKDTLVCYNLALHKEAEGEFEKARELFKTSLKKRPNPSLSERLSFSLYSLRHGHLSEGEAILESTLPELPDSLQPAAKLLLDAIPGKDTAEIDSLSRLIKLPR